MGGVGVRVILMRHWRKRTGTRQAVCRVALSSCVEQLHGRMGESRTCGMRWRARFCSRKTERPRFASLMCPHTACRRDTRATVSLPPRPESLNTLGFQRLSGWMGPAEPKANPTTVGSSCQVESLHLQVLDLRGSAGGSGGRRRPVVQCRGRHLPRWQLHTGRPARSLLVVHDDGHLLQP